MTAPAGPAPEGARFVDLHAHSTASDGAATPTAFAEAAARARLAAVALTDHDTLAGVAEATAAGARLGVRVIAGSELSATDEGREVHLLALHVAEPARLDAELTRFREQREDRAEAIVGRLNELGLAVTLDAVLAQAAGAAVGRPHVARAMVAAGVVRDYREAFDRYLGNGRPAFVAKVPLAVRDAARLTHDAGGILVFAHPGPDGTRERVERMAAEGLDGLEVVHPSHSTEDRARLAALAERLGLVVSGGSDWHGAPDGPRTLGGMNVPHAWLDRQDERVAALRAAGAA